MLLSKCYGFSPSVLFTVIIAVFVNVVGLQKLKLLSLAYEASPSLLIISDTVPRQAGSAERQTAIL